MEKTVVRFSRPLLFRESIDGKYYLAYGFVQEEDKKVDGYDKDLLDEYMGYIAGMHLFAAGAGFFDVNYDLGISIWMDKKGKTHTMKSKWFKRMAEKCRKLLDLTYDVAKMEIDDVSLYDYVNENGFITSDEFHDELKMYIEKSNEEERPF